jgi:hypothetical protein
MGHRARTLAATVAASITTAFAAAAGAQASSLVRVETPAQSASFAALVNRVAASPSGPVQVLDATSGRAAQCDQASPIAALAAVVPQTDIAYSVAEDGTVGITAIKGTSSAVMPPATATWSWAAMADEHTVADLCHGTVPEGTEALFFPRCASPTPISQPKCFTQGALYVRIGGNSPYAAGPITVAGYKADVAINVLQAPLVGFSVDVSLGSIVTTDEGVQASSNDVHREGIATIRFSSQGPHDLRATQAGWVPARAQVCVSEGNDGFCGSTKTQSPEEIPYITPSPCDTNGHDGFCGTTDTSGPVTHVTNITNKKVFKAKKGPGQVKGTIDVDPNGVKDVQLRLTRTVTIKTKVKVKPKKGKKARYRTKTVKRCSAWDDGTLLLKTTKKCGPSSGRFFEAELADLRNAFTYSFALTLPRGSYTLEVVARDEDGHKDVPAVGRNVLKFTVK